MARRNPPGTLQAIREIRKGDPTARVLVLTVSDADSDVCRSREAGALGYAIKDTPTRELFEGIRRVTAGHPYLPGEVASRLYLSPEDARGSSLSTEQLRVLLLTANGKRTKGIARELHVSERTVSRGTRRCARSCAWRPKPKRWRRP
jgi:DNA-binding NarL/FixJ family response regulator